MKEKGRKRCFVFIRGEKERKAREVYRRSPGGRLRFFPCEKLTLAEEEERPPPCSPLPPSPTTRPPRPLHSFFACAPIPTAQRAFPSIIFRGFNVKFRHSPTRTCHNSGIVRIYATTQILFMIGVGRHFRSRNHARRRSSRRTSPHASGITNKMSELISCRQISDAA